MKNDTPNMGWAIAEVIFGLIFACVGFFFLMVVSECSPGAILCGLVLIPVAIFLIPGIATLLAGTYLCWTNGANYPKIQSALKVFLIIYYLPVLGIWLVLGI